jgi:hypothetical protein
MGEQKHQNFGVPMAILATIMFFLFLTIVAWQGNDPDASYWIFIYGYAAGVTAAAFHRTYIVLTAMGALVYLVGAITAFPGLENNVLENEEARESWGLAITSLWMIILSAHWYLRKRGQVFDQ